MAKLRVPLLVAFALLALAAPPALAEVADDNVAIVSRESGDVVLFARAADGTLLMRQGVDGTWSSLGVKVSSGPTATVLPDKSIDVFARETDSGIGHLVVRGSTASAWQSLPELGTISSAPSAAQRRGSPNLDLFARGDDGNLHHCEREGQGAFRLPCTRIAGIVGAPSAASRAANFQDVAVRGTDDNLYTFFRDFNTADGWKGPVPIGQRITAAPSIFAYPGDSNFSFFVRNANRGFSSRYHREPNREDGWVDVDPRPVDSAVAGVDAQTATYAVARSEGDVILKTFQGGWGPWRSIGPAALPAAAAQPQPQPPAPAPAPVGGGRVSFEAGLSCTPRGGKVEVSVDVRKRGDRRKPRVTRVVFFYKRGKRGRVVRTDRKAPFERALPVALRPGTYRVYARIEYKRGRKQGRKTVSRRFAVCR